MASFFIWIPNTEDITTYWSLVILNQAVGIIGLLIMFGVIFKNSSTWFKFMLITACATTGFFIFIIMNIIMIYTDIWTPAGSGLHLIPIIICILGFMVMAIRVIHELPR